MAIMEIANSRHPEYDADNSEWIKWRRAYNGGREFLTAYLQKLSSRELDEDFDIRKKLSYVPKYASAAINEIKNSIFQRMSDVIRTGGPDNLSRSILGELGGVDLQGSTMNTFMGTSVLLELLIMRKVGVLTDAPDDLGVTLQDKGDKHPFFTMYPRESILNWRYKMVGGVRRLISVLLAEDYETESGAMLTGSITTRYRLMTCQNNGTVKVDFYEKGDADPSESVILQMAEIPFHIFEIPYSLMQDVADYQIALMNLESSDISIAMKSNYPLYYEYYDPRTEPQYAKPPTTGGSDGTAVTQEASKTREVSIGGTQGRRVPKDLAAPGFINPASETLIVSMKKGDALKNDIYRMVNLNLENSARSAESKKEGLRTLESNLSFLGEVLQKGELVLGKFWCAFEGKTPDVMIAYPKNYDLKTADQRLEEADKYKKQMQSIPSVEFKRQIAKKIVRTLLGSETSYSVMQAIEREIEAAQTLTTDPDVIAAMHMEGLVAGEEASVAAGFSKGSFEKAKTEHAERLKLIADSQGGPENASPARGISDAGTSKGEKVGKKQRGNGKVGGGTK